MKHSFFSIFLLAGVFACLSNIKDALGTEFYTSNHTVGSPENVQLGNGVGSLSCALPAPSTFDGERTSGTTASLSWSTVPSAAGYRLIVRNLATGEVVSDTIEYGTSKSLSGLDPGTSYRCLLASACSPSETSDFIIADILE